MSLPNTHYGVAEIEKLLKNAETLFFAGIGGVSMQSLAMIARNSGFKVRGYDRSRTPATEHLAECGIEVSYGERAEDMAGVDVLIYTVAISADNAQYKEAVRRGIPTLSRADFLGYIMSRFKNRIGVSGMHGKSTTTAMLDAIFAEADRRPTVTCGAVMNAVKSTFRIGDGDDFVFEACEYMDSFLDFLPSCAVVLNIEMEHVDYFKSLDQIKKSFAAFMKMTESGEGGFAVINADDENTVQAAELFGGRCVTFSQKSEDADYCAKNAVVANGAASFDIYRGGEVIARPVIHMPGSYCITDALAAAAAAHCHGISGDVIERALSSYSGIARRMEYRLRSKNGAEVYTDYAHHPTEITVTLTGINQLPHRRMIAVFQPHTYSRTQELFSGFVEAFSVSPADEVIIADIFSAREVNSSGVSSERLASAIAAHGKPCRAICSFDGIVEELDRIAGDGDIVLVMGAGDIDTVIPRL